jgi:ABC-type glycerol-3-phosphate transport system permease component
MVNRAVFQLQRVRLDKLIYTTLISLLLVVWLFPVALSVLTSIKTDAEMIMGPFALPHSLYLGAYIQAWNLLHLGRLLWNTVIYAIGGSLLANIFAAIPAFALGRFRIPGGKFIFILLLTGIMLPQQTVVIPLADILNKIHLSDSILGLILVHGVYGMPSQLLILRGFIENIPRELESAARVDGASDFGIFRYIILPLLVPAFAVTFTLNFMGIWKEFFFALIFLHDDALFPITVGVLKITYAEYFTSWNLPAATLIIAQLPMIILFIFSYRWITKGIFAGAIKG